MKAEVTAQTKEDIVRKVHEDGTSDTTKVLLVTLGPVPGEPAGLGLRTNVTFGVERTPENAAKYAVDTIIELSA